MKLELPKDCRGYSFDRLFSAEMNDFDVERLLPSLFYLIITGGKQHSSRTNNPTEYNKYLDLLIEHPRLQGFKDSSGKRLLDRWIRSTVVKMGRLGKSHYTQQIEYIIPLTILCYKAGLPPEVRRQRGVHTFIYSLLCAAAQSSNETIKPETLVDHLFREAFARGVNIGSGPKYDGHYDGETELDVNTLLSICYLDGFEPTEASKRESRIAVEPALPKVAKQLGQDLISYILAYHTLLTPFSLTNNLMALINFELFIYTLKLFYATNQLVATATAAVMQETASLPQIYVDFTRNRASDSDQLARICVERDLEELRAYFESVILLRTIDRFVQSQAKLKKSIEKLSTIDYLQSLLSLQNNPDILADAHAEVCSIKKESLDLATETEKEELEKWFEEKELVSKNPLDFNVALLSEAQGKKAVESYVMWYWSVGGLRKPFGLLVGNFQGKRNWRYSMSDDLLATLVHLAMVEDISANLTSAKIKKRLRLIDFLHFLENRYGIIVDRPPDFLDSASARAASHENMEAMKRRLRQMGFFQVLSDDFTAQYLSDPFQQEAK